MFALAMAVCTRCPALLCPDLGAGCGGRLGLSCSSSEEEAEFLGERWSQELIRERSDLSSAEPASESRAGEPLGARDGEPPGVRAWSWTRASVPAGEGEGAAMAPTRRQEMTNLICILCSRGTER